MLRAIWTWATMAPDNCTLNRMGEVERDTVGCESQPKHTSPPQTAIFDLILGESIQALGLSCSAPTPAK